jgi:ring-1,2-phenylacetyl-CoA epoxidase subunit PaaD
MISARTQTIEDVMMALSEVKDPEIPVLSLLEMKIIRDVQIEGNAVKVRITPTFSGCPALDHMKMEVREKLQTMGFDEITLEIDRATPWSTDLLDENVKEKLRVFGVAPPPVRQTTLAATLSLPVECPFCGASNTNLESSFGPTLCRQIFYCDNCRQSFERFKPL